MKTAGNRIAVAAEFATGMKDGQYDFNSRLADFMHGNGDAAAIIDDGNAVVFLNRDFDMRTIPGQRFVDTIVDDFIYQMVQPPFRRTADVHPRPFTNGFQAF